MELTIFRYNHGRGFIYRIPAWIKLMGLCPAAWLIFQFTLPYCITAIIAAAVVSRFSGFSFKEQITDLKPILFYIYFMYAVSVITNVTETGFSALTAKVLIPPIDTVLLILRLLLTMQISSLLFKTTTSIQLQNGLSHIETGIRTVLHKIPVAGSKIQIEPVFAGLISLFIMFISRVFESWNKIELAWKGRGGRNGIMKIKTLLPVLFSVCMTEAEKSFLAVKNRLSA